MNTPTEVQEKLDENYRKKIVFSGVCKQCHNLFTITQGEKDHYEKNNLLLPKRCQNCRRGNSASKPVGTQIPIE